MALKHKPQKFSVIEGSRQIPQLSWPFEVGSILNQKSWFEYHTVVMWPMISSLPLQIFFSFTALHSIVFMSTAKQSGKYFCYNYLFFLNQLWVSIFAILYPVLKKKCALCTVSVYLAGLSNQMEALCVFILTDVNNTLGGEFWFWTCTLQLPLFYFALTV